MKLPLLSLFAASFCTTACQTSTPTTHQQPADWRSLYANPDSFDLYTTMRNLSPEAAAGNPIALHNCFMVAYVRVSDPLLMGCGDEDLYSAMDRILHGLGDARFSRASPSSAPRSAPPSVRFLPGPS